MKSMYFKTIFTFCLQKFYSLLTVLFKGNIKQPSERFTALLELVDCSIRVSHSSATGKRDNVHCIPMHPLILMA